MEIAIFRWKIKVLSQDNPRICRKCAAYKRYELLFLKESIYFCMIQIHIYFNILIFVLLFIVNNDTINSFYHLYGS